MKRNVSKREVVRLAMTVVALVLLSFLASADVRIVENGEPLARIVVAENPPRMTALAVEQLQTYVEKISGAHLPMGNEPDDQLPVNIYVGRSSHTDKLGVSGEGLKHGAYRIVVKDGAVVLLGDDRNYVQKKPFMASLGPRKTYRMTPEFLKEWDALTGHQWTFPYYTNMRNFNTELKVWQQDEAGSFNAVCDLLRELGVRWYLPGEVGEVLPQMTTIDLPESDRTVRPDFPFRHPYQMGGKQFGRTNRDEALWQLRMGFNMPVDVIGENDSGALVHGLKNVSTGRRRDELVKLHPEWFALYSNGRDPEKQCLSSPGLFDEVVAYVRFMFDHYDAAMVSIMPADGFVNLCQCPLCVGKATPERGRRGQLSDYVWDFVVRVAKEVYKTHPDKKVSCFAYGAYLVPPLEIDMLPPNVVVGICQTRCTYIDPAEKTRYVDGYRRQWMKKLPEGHENQFLIWDYYLHANHGSGLPAFFPRIIAEDLRDLKGRCLGEFIEVARDPKDPVAGLAFQHLNLYVNARFWWDADQDLDTLLNDYYEKYYGPAAEEMKAFIEFAETHYPTFKKDAEALAKALALFEKARAKVEPESKPGRRIKLLADYMKPLWPLLEQLKLGGGLERDDNPESWGTFNKKLDVKLDGEPDEGVHQRCYHMVDLKTGEKLKNGANTSVYAAWDDQAGALYVYIVCVEPNMDKLKTGSTRDGDTGIFLGDFVELHIETQNHAYYQIVVNPAGELVDIDRADGKIDFEWSSGATAATAKTDRYWSVEIRIPVVTAAERDLDPDHNGVAGFRPTRQSPWWVNVCRQRGVGEDLERYALSPTGKKGFHDRGKLGRFYVGGKRPGIIKSLERRKREADEKERAARKK